jgi:hypothetical protein
MLNDEIKKNQLKRGYKNHTSQPTKCTNWLWDLDNIIEYES